MEAHGVGATQGSDLLEREVELGQVAERLDRAVAGSGGLVVVEGPAGIGKTALLDAVEPLATRRGVCCLRARGGELEREFSYGVVRQLFEPVLGAASKAERAELLDGAAGLASVVDPRSAAREAVAGASGTGSPFATEHGLYWLTANLAARGPLLLLVDDVHWGDAASLRWLLYLARRLDDLRVLLVVAVRTPGGEGRSELAGRLASETSCLLVQPAPLSEAGVEALVHGALGEHAEQEFSRTCRAVSGGNPFLLAAMLDELSAEGVRPTAAAAAALRDLGPATVARSVVLRIGRLPPAAWALARAVAVLGTGADLDVAAELAGLDRHSASVTADALATAGVLTDGRPLEFVHPMLRVAVHEELATGERAAAHGQAAILLAARGADAERVAVHLLATEPGEDSWPLEPLRQAAAVALARAAPETAVAFLRRALLERVDDVERADILAELGSAEALAGDPSAVEHFTQALDLTTDPVTYAARTLRLGRVLIHADRGPEAIEVLDRGIERLAGRDSELALRLEAEVLAAAHNNVSSYALLAGRIARLDPALPGRTPAERALLALVAMQALPSGQPADRLAELAERALGGRCLLEEEGADAQTIYMAASMLMVADRLDRAQECLSDALTDARARGSVAAFAMASSLRATVLYRRGALADAAADARAALDAAGAHGVQTGPIAVAALVDALVERGQLDAAQAALDKAGPVRELPDEVLSHQLVASRGRLRIAQGDVRAGLDDLLACGRVWDAFDPPGVSVRWRSRAALAHAALGELEQARALAQEAVRRTRRFGAPRALGSALRTAGLIDGTEAGLALLREAVVLLDDSPALLDRAAALTDLGALQRRLGRRSEAREPLLHGLELADRCGAAPLARQARAELRLIGVRPRGSARSGRDALTAAEHRVSTMAAEGQTNRQIAQGLFLTEKTIENHLAHAYAKLGIASRRELTAVLAEDGAERRDLVRGS